MLILLHRYRCRRRFRRSHRDRRVFLILFLAAALLLTLGVFIINRLLILSSDGAAADCWLDGLVRMYVENVGYPVFNQIQRSREQHKSAFTSVSGSDFGSRLEVEVFVIFFCTMVAYSRKMSNVAVASTAYGGY